MIFALIALGVAVVALMIWNTEMGKAVSALSDEVDALRGQARTFYWYELPSLRREALEGDERARGSVEHLADALGYERVRQSDAPAWRKKAPKKS